MTVRVKNNLAAFIAKKQKAAEVAVTKILILGASEASVLTPIHTSLLLNSQYRRVDKTGSRVTGRVGYTAGYALPVHDPANPQRFRRATAEKEFLVKGFDRARDNINRIIRQAMKT